MELGGGAVNSLNEVTALQESVNSNAKSGSHTSKIEAQDTTARD